MNEAAPGAFGWFCQVRDRKTGKDWTYWVNGPRMTRVELGAHVEKHYPRVAFISCQPALAPPDGARLKHVPPEHFQHGILEKVKAEIEAQASTPGRKVVPYSRVPHRR